uniref:Uncharacterized protein n=1 Tax=Arundo donax TaxID=35708 RepID=A0A0A9AXH4_ARUDO
MDCACACPAAGLDSRLDSERK